MRRSPPLHLPFKVLLALALLCACVTGARAQLPAAAPQQRQMPDLVGLTSEQAATRLRRLDVPVSLRAVPSAQPQGIVVSQTPEAGTVIKQGQTATLDVSTGQAPGQTQPGGTTDGQTRTDAPPRQRVVPDLTGMSLTMVRIRLITLGLVPGAVDSVWKEGARGGRVVAQNPAPGTTAEPGRVVSVTLAQRTPPGGQQPEPQQPQPPRDVVIVPSLRNLTAEQARTTVGRARLLLGGVTNDTAGNTAAGTVFSQRPAAGDTVAPGSFVSVSVTQARPAPLPVMPQLVGRPVAEARRVLAAAGLQAGGVGEREAQGAAGRVLTQSIPAGQRVRLGTAVDLVVSRAPVVVPRPDTPVATIPVTPPRDTTPAARQDTPVATQPAQPVDSAATPPADSQAVLQTPATAPAQPAATAPSADVDRPAARPVEPGRGLPREATWALIALLVIAAGAAVWRITRRGPPPAGEPVAAVPVPPVAGSARLRIGTGGWESAQQASEAVSRGKLRLNVRVADPSTVTEAGGAALHPARVAVRTVSAGTPEVMTDGATPIVPGEAVQVRVRDGAPEFTTSEHTPIIHGRR